MPTNIDILQAIAEHLGLSIEDLDRQALLREELGLGSIELNDLLDSLSKKFGVGFKSDEIENVRKVEDLVVLVEDNLLE